MKPTGNPHPTATQRPLLFEALAFALGYFGLAAGAIHLAEQPTSITNVWFANAAAIAMLASSARSRWLVLVLVMIAVNVVANMVFRGNWLLSLSFVPGNVIEVLAGAWLLQHRDIWRNHDHDVRTYFRAIAAGALVPELLGATLGALVLQWKGFASFGTAWLDWYVGSALGAIAVLPPVLALRNLTRQQAVRQLMTRQTVALLFITLGFSYLVLLHMPFPMVYLSIPLIAAALITTPFIALFLCGVMAATAVTAIAYGAVAPPVFSAAWQHVLMFLPIVAMLVPVQLLVIVLERRRFLTVSLSALSSTSTDLSAVIDVQGVVQRVNQAYERYFSRKCEGIQGQAFDTDIPPPLKSGARQSFERALSGRRIRSRTQFEFPGMGKRDIDFSYEPARDADGQIVGVVFAAHDVTDLVAAQKSLELTVAELTQQTRALDEARQRAESADHLKSAFLATMSHELRTPLNSIIGFTGILARGLAGPLNAEQVKQLDMARSSARHLLSLINDILDLSKIEAQQLEVEFQPFSLQESIAKVVSMVQSLADNKGLQLGVQVPPGTIEVTGDQRRFEQVILNLLHNAVKFTDHGEVMLEAVLVADFRGEDASPPAQPGVRLRVSDTGIGIRPEHLSKLFKPFQQLDEGLARAHEGTGLGLAICKRLTGLMGGTIAVESRWSVGTTFTIALPLRPVTAEDFG